MSIYNHKEEDKMFINIEKYVPAGYAQEVMYMGTTTTGIDLYKHCDSRRYINIDDEGNFYLWNGGEVNNYRKVSKKKALEILLPDGDEEEQ